MYNITHVKILSRYVLDLFLTAFLLSFAVISVVLTAGLFTPIAGFLMKGAAFPYLTRLLFVGFHEMLQLTMPLSLFFASVFVFARLASDGELDAMRACGLRLWRVAVGPIFFAVVLSGAFLWVNGELMPREHELRRRLKSELLISSGFQLVDPGDTITDIPDLRLRFEGRDGDTLRDLTVQDIGDPQVTRLLTASRAKMTQDGTDVMLALEDMALEPLDAERTVRLRAGSFKYLLKNAFSTFRYVRRDKDMPNDELLREADEHAQWQPKFTTSARLEYGRRIVYALAPFCFVLLGVGLGSRARRGGLVQCSGIALAVLLGYYLFVLLMTSLERHPALHPEWLIYLSPLSVFAAGAWLMRRL